MKIIQKITAIVTAAAMLAPIWTYAEESEDDAVFVDDEILTDTVSPENEINVEVSDFSENDEAAENVYDDSIAIDNSITYDNSITIENSAGEGSENYELDYTADDYFNTNEQTTLFSASYNPQAALDYAAAHWNDGKGLCAEFVSDCIKAGGLSSWSTSGTALHNQLVKSGVGKEYTIKLNSDKSISMSSYSGKISPGDPVFFYCDNCVNIDKRPYIHTVLCNGADSNGYMKAYSHNNANNGTKKYKYSSTCYQCHAVLTKAVVYHITDVAYAGSDPNLGSPVNVGDDFYAYIINVKPWKHITYDSDGNITIRTENAKSNQIWHFDRLENNAYKITSVKDGKCMEVHNFGTVNGTNVHINDYNNNNAQKWYIYGESANYKLRGLCTDCVLDITGGGTGDGTNVQMWEFNDSDAQKFQIWKLEYPTIPKPTLKVSTSSSTTNNVTFSWNKVKNANWYDIRIYKGETAVKTLWAVTDTKVTISLDPGNYTADIAGVNGSFDNFTFSNKISFSVPTPKPTATPTATPIAKKPSTPTISADKAVYNVNTIVGINFKYDEITTAAVIDIYKLTDGKFECHTHLNITGKTNYSEKFTEAGNYRVNITAANDIGETKSEWAYFDVGKYMVTYNANGGSGAPAEKSKIHGKDMELSKVVPKREGYEFISWNTKQDGSGTSYGPGDSYKIDKAMTLYAIWALQPTLPPQTPTPTPTVTPSCSSPTPTPTVEPIIPITPPPTTPPTEEPIPDPPADGALITIDSAKVRTGETAEIPVIISKNKGFANLSLEISYDSNAMTLTEVRGSTETGATFVKSQNITDTQYVLTWNSTENTVFNGTLAVLVFKINDNTECGKYSVNVDFYKGTNGDYKDGININYDENFNSLGLSYMSGSITVNDHVPGDINGDGVLDGRDGTIFLRRLAGWNIEIDKSAADMNGDDSVDGRDGTVLLRKLAGWDIDIY